MVFILQVLAKYNIMGLGLGLGVAAMAQMRSTEIPSAQPQNVAQTQRFEAATNNAVESTERRFTGTAQNDISKVQTFFYR